MIRTEHRICRHEYGFRAVVHDHVGHAAEDRPRAAQPPSTDEHHIWTDFVGELRQSYPPAALDPPKQRFGPPPGGSGERDAHVGELAGPPFTLAFDGLDEVVAPIPAARESVAEGFI